MHPTCLYLAMLRPYMLCILGAPTNSPMPILPSPSHTIQFVQFTYYHKIFKISHCTQTHQIQPSNRHAKKQWLECKRPHNLTYLILTHDTISSFLLVSPYSPTSLITKNRKHSHWVKTIDTLFFFFFLGSILNTFGRAYGLAY